MRGTPARTLTTLWFYGVAVVCALLIVGTALHVIGVESASVTWLLNKIDLGLENNAGVWWSGMLLALVSLHAFDGYVLLRSDEPGAARGWAMLAAVLLFLSFDEVGSLHERLSILARSLPLRGWTVLLPIGAVLAAVCLRAMILLWRVEGQRHKLWLLAIGFALLGSVALQEHLEHTFAWQSRVANSIRVAVEEGTELLGMLLLLRVAMANTTELAHQSMGTRRTVFAALHELRGPLVTIGLALAPALAVATAALVDYHRGRPADWLAAAAFLAAGLVLCRLFLMAGRGGVSWATWLVGGLCCLASVAVVAISPLKLVALGPVDVSLKIGVVVAVSILVGAAWACGPDGRGRPYALGAVVIGVLTAVLLPSTNLLLVYGLPQLLGLALYWINSTIVKEIESGPGIADTSRQADTGGPALTGAETAKACTEALTTGARLSSAWMPGWQPQNSPAAGGRDLRARSGARTRRGRRP